jgi:hypothetical protein
MMFISLGMNVFFPYHLQPLMPLLTITSLFYVFIFESKFLKFVKLSAFIESFPPIVPCNHGDISINVGI